MMNNLAIVIGINYYEHLSENNQLKYAVKDAEEIKRFLCNQASFKPDNVLLCTDNSQPTSISIPRQPPQSISTRPTRSNLRRLLREKIPDFKDIRLNGVDNFWFFFSGHGGLSNNNDYLMPCDSYFSDLDGTAIDVEFVIRCIMKCYPKNIVMVLDMCRNQSNSKGCDDIGEYTKKIANQRGIITIFSCQRGYQSHEIPELQQGSFTYALIEALTQYKTPRTIEQYLQHRVPAINYRYGKPEQLPIISLEPINKSDLPLFLTLNQQQISTENSVTIDNPGLPLVSKGVTENLVRLSNQEVIKPLLPGTSVFNFTTVTVDIQGREITHYQGEVEYFTEDLGNGVFLDMVVIPGGTFLMGSPKNEKKGFKRFNYDEPQHQVTVKPFLMSKHTITYTQWKAVASLPKIERDLKKIPSRNWKKNLPVEISWHDAVEFCKRLSEKTGYQYRLPTEAEWEYACRAGTTTPFHFGQTITSNLANYDGTYTYESEPKGIYRNEITPIGTSPFPNAFGLFDMHGNVWEWCIDHWHNNYDNAPTLGEAWLDSSDNEIRVLRGGSCKSEPLLCRSAYRHRNDAFSSKNGLRIARNL